MAYRRVPPMMRVSWGTAVSLDLRKWGSTVDMSTLLMNTVPETTSASRKMALTSVDLPLPVLPQMPIFSPWRTIRLTPVTTGSRHGWYVMDTSFKRMLPSSGHPERSSDDSSAGCWDICSFELIGFFLTLCRFLPAGWAGSLVAALSNATLVEGRWSTFLVRTRNEPPTAGKWASSECNWWLIPPK